tara:strand:+ start:844 stop:1305 length:462 start_codon:yes stop_codon:yes gene_type:complete
MNSQKRIIACASSIAFLLNILFFPSISYADERVTALSEGEPAPYDGTLFNTEAAARLIANIEFSEEACQIRIDEALDYQTARHDLEIANLNASLETLDLRYTQTIALRDNQIQFLDAQMSKRKVPQEVTFLLGVLAGVGLTIGSAYAISEVAR